MLSGLSHHYSWHKALVSLKPLLDFLSPTSAYQQPSRSPFRAQARGRGGAGGAGEGSPQMSGDPSPRQSCPAASGLTGAGLGHRTWSVGSKSGPPNNAQNKSPGSHALAVSALATPSRPESKRAGEKDLKRTPHLLAKGKSPSPKLRLRVPRTPSPQEWLVTRPRSQIPASTSRPRSHRPHASPGRHHPPRTRSRRIPPAASKFGDSTV